MGDGAPRALRPCRLVTLVRGTRDTATQVRAEVVRCVLESLAEGYAVTLCDAGHFIERRNDRVRVVGEGSSDVLLCRLTADR